VKTSFPVLILPLLWGLASADPQPAADETAQTHPYYLGQTLDPGLVAALELPWDHNALLAEQPLLAVLGEALSAGILTGYDLRDKNIYAGFPKGHTFIYSHSSRLHLQQLVSLMAAHDLAAEVFVAPKVSAFLYRDDWGTANENVATLPGGTRVVNGREVAVMFRFESPQARADFHALIQRYAKKDEQDEPGLIAHAWWQPFYYTDQPMEGFAAIALVIMSSQRFEATLTVLPEKAETVAAALSGRGFPVRTEQVWVNPAFLRFLNGGYR